MKKSILTGVALLGFAAVTYGQNVSTVTQTGNSQSAVADQTGNGQVSTISQVQSGTTTNFGNFGGTKQTGTTSNTATVNQNDGSKGNRGYAVQLGGNGNQSTINQNNSGGGTTKATENAAGGDGNLAGTAQVGTGNTAVVNQNNDSQRNLGEVRQNGTTNVGTVNQSNASKDNKGLIYQGYSEGNVPTPSTGVTNSTATINQGKTDPSNQRFPSGAAESLNNEATIIQTADNNKATVNQGAFGDADNDGATSAGRSVGSKATVNQSDAGNTALINQGFESGEALGSLATVEQTGMNNQSKINQGSLNFGQDNASKAMISQAGTGSKADIRQGFLATSTNNEATITQMTTANGVESQIFQGFGGKSTSKNDKGEVIQGGSGTNFLGYAGIFQGSVLYTSGTANSSGNTAKITQAVGTFNNEADINQGFETSGSAIDNKATIEQKSGKVNDALISQGSAVAVTNGLGTAITTGLVSTSSTASATQDGDNNTIRVYQADGTGTGGHMATLMQTGNMNTARLYQEGTKQMATITQAGDANILDGGVAGSVATQLGDTNTATVMQTSATGGPGNVGHLMQAGSGNSAMITQSNVLP